jgi:Tetratricopeptide repeat
VSRLADRLTGLDRAARAGPRVGGLPSLVPGEGRGLWWNPLSLLVILLVIVTGIVIGGGLLLQGRRSEIESGPGALRRTPGAAVEAPGRPGPPDVARLPGPALPPALVAATGTPGGQTALVDRGVARARAGALAEAADDFRQALAHEPSRVDLWNNLGVVLVRAGDVGAGLAAFREALALVPRDAETHRNLAVVLDRQGLVVEAARHYRAFLEAAPPDHPDRAEVGRRLASRGPRRGRS